MLIRRNLPGEGGRAAVGAALSGPQPEPPTGNGEPAGKMRGAAAPPSGRPERGPAFRQPPALPQLRLNAPPGPRGPLKKEFGLPSLLLERCFAGVGWAVGRGGPRVRG